MHLISAVWEMAQFYFPLLLKVFLRVVFDQAIVTLHKRFKV